MNGKHRFPNFKRSRKVGIRDYKRAWDNMQNELKNGPVITIKPAIPPIDKKA